MSIEERFKNLDASISSVTQSLIRSINIEWQKIGKCEETAILKREEIAAAEESTIRLKEKKNLLEKHLRRTENKIETLRKSNNELKKNVLKLRREEEKSTSELDKKKQKLKDTLTLHRAKWEDRYQTRYANKPWIQELEQARETFNGATEQLKCLKSELRQRQAEVFKAKCERGRRNAEESGFYPLKNFIVRIAGIGAGIFRIKNAENVVLREILKMQEQIDNCKAFKAQSNQSEEETLLCPAIENVNLNALTNMQSVQNISNLQIQSNFTSMNSAEVNVSEKITPNEDYQCIRNTMRYDSGTNNNQREALMTSISDPIKNSTLKSIVTEQKTFIQNSNINRHIPTKNAAQDLAPEEGKTLVQGSKIRQRLEKLKLYTPVFSSPPEKEGFKVPSIFPPRVSASIFRHPGRMPHANPTLSKQDVHKNKATIAAKRFPVLSTTLSNDYSHKSNEVAEEGDTARELQKEIENNILEKKVRYDKNKLPQVFRDTFSRENKDIPNQQEILANQMELSFENNSKLGETSTHQGLDSDNILSIDKASEKKSFLYGSNTKVMTRDQGIDNNSSRNQNMNETISENRFQEKMDFIPDNTNNQMSANNVSNKIAMRGQDFQQETNYNCPSGYKNINAPTNLKPYIRLETKFPEKMEVDSNSKIGNYSMGSAQLKKDVSPYFPKSNEESNVTFKDANHNVPAPENQNYTAHDGNEHHPTFFSTQNKSNDNFSKNNMQLFSNINTEKELFLMHASQQAGETMDLETNQITEALNESKISSADDNELVTSRVHYEANTSEQLKMDGRSETVTAISSSLSGNRDENQIDKNDGMKNIEEQIQRSQENAVTQESVSSYQSMQVEYSPTTQSQMILPTIVNDKPMEFDRTQISTSVKKSEQKDTHIFCTPMEVSDQVKSPVASKSSPFSTPQMISKISKKNSPMDRMADKPQSNQNEQVTYRIDQQMSVEENMQIFRTPTEINEPMSKPVSTKSTPIEDYVTQGENSSSGKRTQSDISETNQLEQISNQISPFDFEKHIQALNELNRSPNFTYPSRFMYTKKEPEQNNQKDASLRDAPKDISFEPMPFINMLNASNSSLESEKTKEKSRFLSFDDYDYLADSPPSTMAIGKEKSMFAFGEDSPKSPAKSKDFFPLFAADTGKNENENNTKSDFVFNFGGASGVKSPENDSSFKFLF